ncbi:hypothetical protein G7Y89_g12755 [Cudoniella acicularis]|uniref:Phenol 2-monooxygenase n=1 Tax=Cudoniella acicularis TaxID=354080 RepID=A0A8H4VYV3_9HELO|nr:hypothetical protein G7Y89_g12755 [Cudoniella acicularis]
MAGNKIEEYDVVICGSGSAGLCAAAYLARCGLSCKVIEARDGPLKMGQADGVQCRTVEIMESFGMADDLLRESYHVLEDVFWSRAEGGKLVRTRVTGDTAKGLSHMPHVIINQARLHEYLLDGMKRWHGQEVEYGKTVVDVKVDEDAAAADPESYAVTITYLSHGETQTIRSRYVLGCDGAHSTVRRSLGYKMVGDSTDAVWGVMDIHPVTDFPDIRKKAILRTASTAVLIIPREGGSLVRFYIELSHGTTPSEVTLKNLQSAAQEAFHPYKLEFPATIWWSAYYIGQRHADFFSKDNRVFLTGDACHTHSPKAGQGMNTSLQDGYNIGWKLAAVLRKQVSPNLLRTYNLEREVVAIDLIKFDRKFAAALSAKSKEDFADFFVKSGRYTAGLTKRYDQSEITNISGSTASLARGLDVGMRFPSTQVVRFCDAKPVQLAQALPADGRWRIVAFPGDIQAAETIPRLEKLASYLTGGGPIATFTGAGEDVDSFIETIVVLYGERLKLEQEQIPDYFWPVTGKYRIRDLHKVYVDEESYNNGHGHAYEFYGVDAKAGAVAIIRPDQHVSLVSSVDELKAIGDFFAGFALPREPEK